MRPCSPFLSSRHLINVRGSSLLMPRTSRNSAVSRQPSGSAEGNLPRIVRRMTGTRRETSTEEVEECILGEAEADAAVAGAEGEGEGEGEGGEPPTEDRSITRGFFGESFYFWSLTRRL